MDAVDSRIPNRLKERVPWGNPFERRVLLEVFLVENDPSRIPGRVCRTGAPARSPAESACVGSSLLGRCYCPCLLPVVNAGFRGGNDEEILDGLGHEAAFLGLDALANYRREVQFSLREPL